MDKIENPFLASVMIICIFAILQMTVPSLWLDQELSTVQKEYPTADLNLITCNHGETYIYCVTDYVINEGILEIENKVVVLNYNLHWFYRYYVDKYEIIELEHNCEDCGDTGNCIR